MSNSQIINKKYYIGKMKPTKQTKSLIKRNEGNQEVVGHLSHLSSKTGTEPLYE